MKLSELYKQWCKDTKRNGGILVGGSVKEFIEYVEKDYVLTDIKANEHLEMEMNLLLNEALIGNRIKREDVHSNGIAQYIIDFMERRGLK